MEMQKSTVVSLSHSAKFDQLGRERMGDSQHVKYSSPLPESQTEYLPHNRTTGCVCGGVDGFIIHQLKLLSLFPVLLSFLLVLFS